MSGKIVHIATAVPEHAYLQSDILAFMHATYAEDRDTHRLLNMLYRSTGIARRHSVLADYKMQGEGRLFRDFEHVPGLSARLATYQDAALKLGQQVAEECLKERCEATEITHLITVSCTGLFAPGLEFQLMDALNLSSETQRHPINFVGCYAAVPALNLAQTICAANPEARVLLVSVELCTLHFQRSTDRDTLMANALFSDGAAACLIVGEAVDLEADYRLGSYHAEVHRDGDSAMTWIPSEKGFLMRLSSYVPKLIRKEIAEFVGTSLEKASVSASNVAWAFHPGGIQILRKLEEALDIEASELAVSYDVLREFGNMSSPTVLFVLARLMAEKNTASHLYACAFGPGLTFESIILDHV
ncbi:MAG: type III polyketide synthase [Bacteroidota bacterium]